MATLPVRQLGAVGVVTDASPYSLPLNAFSSCNNVLFDEGRVQRAPVFKTLYDAIRSNQPIDPTVGSIDSQTGTFENTLGAISKDQRFITSYSSADKEAVVVCDIDGVIREYVDGALSVITPGTGQVTNVNPWTHAQAAGLSVLARKGMRPYIRNIATEATYGLMRNDWDPTHTCAVIRAYGDFLVALNVTKGSTAYPTMIKWCDPLQYSPNPDSGVKWNPADTSLLSGENVLGEMATPIRDGLTLGSNFVIYSQDQVWLMDFTGSQSVFSFRKLFPSGGIIATNCVAEVEGRHFVFGEDDLYVHDGMGAPKSIADERVRHYVYSNMDRSKKDSFFLHHDSVLNLVYFAYVSKETSIGFPGTQYCNRAAVYNYRNNNWTFMDLPNIAGGAETDLNLTQAGYSSGATSETPRVSVMLGVTDLDNHLTESRVYTVDTPDVGIVRLPAHPETVKPAFVERIGISLDKEAAYEVMAYKLIKGIYPLVMFHPENTLGNLKIQIGASDTVEGDVRWEDEVTFDHLSDYKVDSRAAGRYLALRVTSDTTDFFRFTGFDVDTLKTARR